MGKVKVNLKQKINIIWFLYKYVSGGNVPELHGLSTYCQNCRNVMLVSTLNYLKMIITMKQSFYVKIVVPFAA